MNKDLLAATSVFAELLNKSVDYRDVVDDFILSVFKIESNYSQDSQEVFQNLSNYYDFDIPEGVVMLHLKRLTSKGLLEYRKPRYNLLLNESQQIDQFISEIQIKEESQKTMLSNLIKSVEVDMGPLDREQKKLLNTQFIEFLFNDNYNGEFSDKILKFILKNSGDSGFLHELNMIRTGILILRGIKYSSIDAKSDWKKELIIYLDTEHLFNILGFNGELYKKILIDFYNLVREINIREGKKVIHLKYFEDVEWEVLNFFKMAQDIKEKNKYLKLGRSAMVEILKGTYDKSDIVKKESKFFGDLNSMGIYKAEYVEVPEDKISKYNIENIELLERYGNNEEEAETRVIRVLKLFTKINYLRRGDNCNGFEKIKHILVTGDTLTKNISKDVDSKYKSTDFSFATDIYYATQRLWYNLNKGLGFKNNTLPTYLDVVARTQVVLAGKLSTEVNNRFEKIIREIQEGKRTEESCIDYYMHLRSNVVKPEEINSDNVDEKISFLYQEDEIEKYARERSLLASEVNELREFKRQKEEEEIKAREEKEIKKNKLREQENIRACLNFIQ